MIRLVFNGLVTAFLAGVLYFCFLDSERGEVDVRIAPPQQQQR